MLLCVHIHTIKWTSECTYKSFNAKIKINTFIHSNHMTQAHVRKLYTHVYNVYHIFILRYAVNFILRCFKLKRQTIWWNEERWKCKRNQGEKKEETEREEKARESLLKLFTATFSRKKGAEEKEEGGANTNSRKEESQQWWTRKNLEQKKKKNCNNANDKENNSFCRCEKNK